MATLPHLPNPEPTQLLFRRYRIIRQLGRGGMGVVYLAHDSALDVPVAIKLIPDAVANDTEAVVDLRKEVLRGMALAHPGVVRTHHFERDESGAPLGSLTLRALISVSPPDALNRLVGRDARILLGNRTGDLWTDLTSIVAGPTIDLASDGGRTYSTPDGDARIGAIEGLASTPWVVWVEFPREAAVVRARAFLRRMSVFGLLIALGTILLTRWFVISLIRPLTEMTSAAEATAGSRPTLRSKCCTTTCHSWWTRCAPS